MKYKQNYTTAQAGFTLLEVMVVIVIIGLMATIIIPNIMGSKDKADKQKASADISVLDNGLEMYRLDNDNYPTSDQGLKALVEKPDIDPVPTNYREGGYIRRLPKDPWAHEYKLHNPGKHSMIDIFSLGPDGKEGTSDDIGNWMQP